MEFTVSRNELLTALQHTRLAICKRNGIPMFGDFIMTFRNDSQLVMTVHTSNGEIFMTEDVVLDGTNGELRPISIYYNDLLPAIKALDEQPLRFVVGDYQVTVHHDIGTFRLPLANTTNEFLSWKVPCPDVEAEDCHTMYYEAPALASILSRCSYAMAQDELRPVMNGIHFNFTANYSDYVTSDEHILVRVRKAPVCYDNKRVVTNFIIPARVASILKRVLPKTGDVDIDYQEKLEKTEKKFINDGNGGRMKEETVTVHNAQCRITIDDNLTISFNPIDGRYPNYLNVIPSEGHNKYEMLINRRELTKSLDRLSLFAPDSGFLRMYISHDKLRLNTANSDYNIYGEETLPCECNIDDATMRMGIKAVTLSKTLKAMSTEKVVMRIEDGTRAFFVNPQPQPDNEELTYLLMPMMCD